METMFASILLTKTLDIYHFQIQENGETNLRKSTCQKFLAMTPVGAAAAKSIKNVIWMKIWHQAKCR